MLMEIQFFQLMGVVVYSTAPHGNYPQRLLTGTSMS
jgi:hypothetical protein